MAPHFVKLRFRRVTKCHRLGSKTCTHKSTQWPWATQRKMLIVRLNLCNLSFKRNHTFSKNHWLPTFVNSSQVAPPNPFREFVALNGLGSYDLLHVPIAVLINKAKTKWRYIILGPLCFWFVPTRASSKEGQTRLWLCIQASGRCVLYWPRLRPSYMRRLGDPKKATRLEDSAIAFTIKFGSVPKKLGSGKEILTKWAYLSCQREVIAIAEGVMTLDIQPFTE